MRDLVPLLAALTGPEALVAAVQAFVTHDVATTSCAIATCSSIATLLLGPAFATTAAALASM